jgi:hypothetical protein
MAAVMVANLDSTPDHLCPPGSGPVEETEGRRYITGIKERSARSPYGGTSLALRIAQLAHPIEYGSTSMSGAPSMRSSSTTLMHNITQCWSSILPSLGTTSSTELSSPGAGGLTGRLGPLRR